MDQQTTVEFLIPADVLQAVVDYLGQRPWKEVARVMPELMQLRMHEKEKKKTEED